jgi:hypothetical protein
MGVVQFKAETPHVPKVVNDKNDPVTDDQLESAQYYVDRIARETTNVTKEDWEYIYFVRENGLNLRCCFTTIGPHLRNPYWEGARDPKVWGNLRLQEAEMRKWLPNAPNLDMYVFEWSEVYCVNIPLPSESKN